MSDLTTQINSATKKELELIRRAFDNDEHYKSFSFLVDCAKWIRLDDTSIELPRGYHKGPVWVTRWYGEVYAIRYLGDNKYKIGCISLY